MDKTLPPVTVIKPYNMDEAIAVFAGALTHKTRIKWLKWPRAEKESLIRKAFEQGVMTNTRGDHERFH